MAGLSLATELDAITASKNISADVLVMALCWMLADLVLLAERERGVSREHSYRTIASQVRACSERLAAFGQWWHSDKID